MSKYAIYLIDFTGADQVARDLALTHVGKYVSHYDPDGMLPDDILQSVENVQDAIHYKDFDAAADAWRRVSKKWPVRSDGKPNRPLTAYTVEIVKVPEHG